MNAIVNISPKWGIGSNHRLLVHIRKDMRRFREITEHNTIIVGRETLATFPNGQPLKNRENIVMTRNPDFRIDGAVACHDITMLKTLLSERDPNKVFVCGGEQIYRLLLPYCEKVLVTLTYTDTDADRYFPNLNQLEQWILTEVGEKQYENDIAFRFLTYCNQNVLPF